MFKKKEQYQQLNILYYQNLRNTHTAHREKTIDSNYYILTEDWKLTH